MIHPLTRFSIRGAFWFQVVAMRKMSPLCRGMSQLVSLNICCASHSVVIGNFSILIGRRPLQGEHNVVTHSSRESYACIFKETINGEKSPCSQAYWRSDTSGSTHVVCTQIPKGWRDAWTGIGDFPFMYEYTSTKTVQQLRANYHLLHATNFPPGGRSCRATPATPLLRGTATLAPSGSRRQIVCRTSGSTPPVGL